jgi:phytoene synthase
LLALAAYSAEVRRIPMLVHEPAMADLRAQWWRDSLALPPELRTGSPVADAVRAEAALHGLPTELLLSVIDVLPQAGAGGDTATRLQRYLWHTEGVLFALSAQVLGVPSNSAADAACAACGEAYGLARLLTELPALLAQGQAAAANSVFALLGLPPAGLPEEGALAHIPLPLAGHIAQIGRNLATARHFVTGLPRSQRTAFLPLALVKPYVRVVEHWGGLFPQAEAIPSVSPLTRVWRIAAAHLKGRP